MRVYLFCFSLLLVLLASSSAIAEREISSDAALSVKLYGQSFTLDIQAIDAADVHAPYTWHDTTYKRIREILPDILEGQDLDMKGVLNKLGQATVSYQYLYDMDIGQLARTLHEEGFFEIAFLRSDEEGYFLASHSEDAIYQEMMEAPEDSQIDFLKSVITAWIENGDWEENVDAYNSLRVKDKKSPALTKAGFVGVNRAYKNYLSVYILDYAVRQSPEVQEAGLEKHGILLDLVSSSDQQATTTAPSP